MLGVEERVSQRRDEVLAILGSLADRNDEIAEHLAWLSDQAAKSLWRIEQLETRFGLLRAALSDDAPMLTRLDEVLDGLDGP